MVGKKRKADLVIVELGQKWMDRESKKGLYHVHIKM
jgi:hypothetical protein